MQNKLIAILWRTILVALCLLPAYTSLRADGKEGDSSSAKPSHKKDRAKERAKPASIGVATMTSTRIIILDLRAEIAGGVGESRLTYTPSDTQYKAILKHLGGLRPGQSKPVPPWKEEPQHPVNGSKPGDKDKSSKK